MSKSIHEYRLEKRFQHRLYFFASVIFVIIIVFIIQLASLQLVHGYENRVLAKKFVSHREYTVAPRGLIFDRNFEPGHEPLIQNLRFIDFVIHPDQFDNRKEAIAYVRLFCKILGRDYNDYAHDFTVRRWKQILRKNKFVTLLKRMTRREHERLAAFHFATKGGEYVTQHLRYYTMGPALAHVSGYIGLPSARDLKKKGVQSYQNVGKGGLEERYDNRLRGRDGVRMRHRIIDQEEQISDTQQGYNLILTIDKELQAVAYNSLTAASKRGAVVAMRAATGEILALVSHPSFDPNILASGNAKQRKKHLQEVRAHNGFLNLAIQAKFPPASTFKPLVALSALENTLRSVDGLTRKFTPEYSHTCRNVFTLKSSRPGRPDAKFHCWSRHGHVNMIDAIAHSCNVYFYSLGYQLGPTPIIEFSRTFGLDKVTGVDLLGEITGHVPDPHWKRVNFSSSWYDGDTVNLSIGQGFLQTTPIGLAVLYAALANRGKIYRPWLVKEVRDPIDNHLIQKFNPTLLREIPLSLEALTTVQKGMRRVVTHGTGRRLAHIKTPIAGKTGTVQTRSRRNSHDHALFASYAPYDAPIEDVIVVVIFVEYGLAGSASAAPIAGEIYKAILAQSTKRKTLNDL